jgi:hypothetical protein
MSYQYDINNNPIYTPSLNQSNYDFRLPDELSDDSLEFYRLRQNNDDNLSLGDQLDDNENNYFHNVNALMQNFEQHIQNNPHEAWITEVETQMHTNPEILVNVRRTYPIFRTEKTTIGRRKKDRIYLNKAKHTRSEKKNVLTRNKKASYNNFLDYFNKEIKNTKDKEIQKEKIELKKITNSVIGVCSKEDNLDLLKLPMKDILSNPLMKKFKRIDKNYNKNSINFILGRKDEKLISLLNKNFESVIRVFAGDLKDKDFDGFKTIEDEIEEIKENIKENPCLELEETEYIKTYRYYAKNYKQTLLDMDKRAPRKKKND